MEGNFLTQVCAKLTRKRFELQVELPKQKRTILSSCTQVGLKGFIQAASGSMTQMQTKAGLQVGKSRH
jgi:hypothetical protein